MELVIKLDDETYKEVMDRTEFDTLSLGIKLIEAVQNGTPLEEELKKIKAKIEKENEPYIRMWETGFDDVSYGKYRAYRKAIGFIVKRIDELEGETDKEYEAKVITRGNCMMCGKELTEGLFLCEECENKSRK